MTLVGRNGASTVVSTGQLATDLDETQYESGYGPCLDAAAGGEVLLVDDTTVETRWPRYAEAAARCGASSSISLPIPLQRHATAALNVYGGTPHAFDADSKDVASTFASYAGVALANMHLYESTRQLAEQMQTAMASRAVIDQAKGIVMARERCSPAEAFDTLVQISQRSNRKLRDVATALVDDAVNST